MTHTELHELLAGHFGLVPEPIDNGVSRTYFIREVQWHPQRSTRVVRVLAGTAAQAARIQLCASSDNNNTVLITAPFSAERLRGLLAEEISLVEARLATAGAAGSLR
ncbi:hypothetical protein [Acidovorax sp. LjRoot117]|uniref:hypothetical protein n=1 Tax=Acidovorax sp. LjRoot117 TaxID=3342255 RepID=UPI003ED12388